MAEPPCRGLSVCESRYSCPAMEGPMDDTKQTEEQATAAQPEQAKKPITEQMTDLLATAAGALAEGAVRSVAKRVRKTAAKKTPAPMKKAAQAVANAAKRPKKAKK